MFDEKPIFLITPLSVNLISAEFPIALFDRLVVNVCSIGISWQAPVLVISYSSWLVTMLSAVAVAFAATVELDPVSY